VYDPADGSDESVIIFTDNVTLAVDLTAGFNLTGIEVSLDAAEQASAAISLQYPVKPTLRRGARSRFRHPSRKDPYCSFVLK
jgi:hypothetical protein